MRHGLLTAYGWLLDWRRSSPGATPLKPNTRQLYLANGAALSHTGSHARADRPHSVTRPVGCNARAGISACLRATSSRTQRSRLEPPTRRKGMPDCVLRADRWAAVSVAARGRWRLTVHDAAASPQGSWFAQACEFRLNCTKYRPALILLVIGLQV